jgi:hypothetical protein
VADEDLASNFGSTANRKLKPTMRRFCQASVDLILTGEFSDPTKLNADQTETRSGFTAERWP